MILRGYMLWSSVKMLCKSLSPFKLPGPCWTAIFHLKNTTSQARFELVLIQRSESFIHFHLIWQVVVNYIEDEVLNDDSQCLSPLGGVLQGGWVRGGSWPRQRGSAWGCPRCTFRPSSSHNTSSNSNTVLI